MNNEKFTVQYIGHSGFRVETDRHLFIFDYYHGVVHLDDKPLIVFVSHGHPDHFNPAILEWQTESPHIQYVFSSDIDLKSPHSNITSMSAYEMAEVGDVKIKTYGSTDLGVSFLLECDGVRIFHAGDLNWWYWWEDTAEGIALAEAGFKEEVTRIKGEKIDLAFFPVDPRLEHNADLGAEYFCSEIKPHYLIPMHFWDNEQCISRFAEKQKGQTTQVIILSKPGQEISF